MTIPQTITHFRIKYLRWMYGPISDSIREIRIRLYRKKQVARLEQLTSHEMHVFYFGITEQPNLGDMAQHYCIKNWILDNYPERQLIMFESSVITDSRFTKAFFAGLANVFREDDIIVFQSGYCTQDLGGDHPLMHRLVCQYMPNAKMLMMPQTVFFQKEENKLVCSANHNNAKNMLFLARDSQSYKMAKEMFPDIRVKTYPDIVTTLIGTMQFSNLRNGVCLCVRNDGEKYYSDEEILSLARKIQADGTPLVVKDTQGKCAYRTIRLNVKQYVEQEIESYSHYDVTITDRYHGTIFSLCAGTPVIIIKTNDHKVTTGAEWFEHVYDGYVYVANDLNDAYRKSQEISKCPLDHNLKPYFKTMYYDRLKELFES